MRPVGHPLAWATVGLLLGAIALGASLVAIWLAAPATVACAIDPACLWRWR